MPRQEERAKLGMKPDESLPAKDKKVCATLKEQNTANVQEGIDNLNKALKLRPDYDDAMAYMNLMYRERADIQCDDPAARSEDLKTADEWVDKTMATKKAKAEKQPSGADRHGSEQVNANGGTGILGSSHVCAGTAAPRRPAPKGAFNSKGPAASLKRCPDTKPNPRLRRRRLRRPNLRNSKSTELQIYKAQIHEAGSIRSLQITNASDLRHADSCCRR